MTLALLLLFLMVAFWLWLGFRSLRSIDPRVGKKLKLRIEPFTGFGKPVRFKVIGRVSKDAGLLSQINTEFDLAKITTRVRRNLRRLILPDMEGVRLEVHVAGVIKEVVTDARGKFETEFERNPSLPTGATVYSVQLHPEESRFEAEKALGQIIVPSELARVGVISDIDDTIVLSHTGNKLRMVLHALLTSVSDLRPTPGIGALISALHLGLQRNEANPVFYVSGSPANIHYKLHAFLRANRIPVGPMFLTGIAREPVAGFFNQKEFKTECIREIFETFPKLKFVLLGDNLKWDPDIYQQIALKFPGRVAATLIFERIPFIKIGKFLPPGQNRVGTTLDGGLILYKKGLISKEGLQTLVNDLIAEGILKDSFRLDKLLRRIERRDRENRVLFLER